VLHNEGNAIEHCSHVYLTEEPKVVSDFHVERLLCSFDLEGSSIGLVELVEIVKQGFACRIQRAIVLFPFRMDLRLQLPDGSTIGKSL